MSAPQLLLATNNAGKIAEFRELLAGCGWEIVTPRDLGLKLDVEEAGTTYSENAYIKAQAFSEASGLAALADDSGLEVDALDGQPGALHHLHGWDGRNDAERVRILLDALKAVPHERWTGRYQAAVVVVLPNGRVLEGQGTEEGRITETPAGTNGFGYDPIFYLPELQKTAAELSMAEKNLVSHRALATFAVRDQLRALAEQAAEG